MTVLNGNCKGVGAYLGRVWMRRIENQQSPHFNPTFPPIINSSNQDHIFFEQIGRVGDNGSRAGIGSALSALHHTGCIATCFVDIGISSSSGGSTGTGTRSGSSTGNIAGGGGGVRGAAVVPLLVFTPEGKLIQHQLHPHAHTAAAAATIINEAACNGGAVSSLETATYSTAVMGVASVRLACLFLHLASPIVW
jgi:hypothetical protein